MPNKSKPQLQEELTTLGIAFSPTAKVAELLALLPAKEPTEPEKVKITVTAEWLEAHPDAVASGVKIGDEVEVAEAPAPVGIEPTEPVLGGTVPDLKKGEGYSILKSGEYIRTYANKEDAVTFCTKKASEGVHAVPESSVVGITVEYEGKTETGALTSLYKNFNVDEQGQDFKSEAIKFKNSEKNSFAKAILADQA